MQDGQSATSIAVDVVFDPACPWCFIGKRRFEQALANRPDVVANVAWRPFLLHPDMPSRGLPRRDYLTRRYGGETRVRRVLRAITEAGQSSRIAFAFDTMHRAPNSIDAHRLVRFAEAEGLQHAAVEALFHEHFVRGRDIGDAAVLVAIGREIGLDGEALGIYLSSEADIAWVREEHARAGRVGVTGVPSFIFNGAFVIAGAQEPRILAKMLDVARESARLSGPVTAHLPIGS